MSVLYRNNEQYYDPTAGAALKEWERSMKMQIKPGDIVRLTKQGMAKTQDVPFAVLGGAVAEQFITNRCKYDKV